MDFEDRVLGAIGAELFDVVAADDGEDVHDGFDRVTRGREAGCESRQVLGRFSIFDFSFASVACSPARIPRTIERLKELPKRVTRFVHNAVNRLEIEQK
jgi:hypothetical protein